MKKFLLTSALILSASLASAADNKDGDFFDNFVKENKEFHGLLNLKVTRVFQLTYPTCTEAVKASRHTPAVLLPLTKRPTPRPTEDENGETKSDKQDDVTIIGNKVIKKELEETEDQKQAPSPIYGQWIEKVTAKACDKTVLINHLAVGYKKQEPVILPLINGATSLDPIDQPFAEKAIVARLKKLEKPCDTAPFIMNSSILGYRTKDGGAIQKTDSGYGWFERWNIRACGARYDANIVILPDPKTRYRYIARLKEME